MTGRDAVTSADGTTIGYDVYGSGPGIVLLPGALHAGHHYRALAGHLADAYTVYAVDRRGRPGSGPQRPDHGIEAECADVIAVLERTGATQVFGHSSGGVVALQTALRHPIAKVAVYDPPVSVNGSIPIDFLPGYERAVAEGRNTDAVAILMKHMRIGGPVDRIPLVVLKRLLRFASRRAGPDIRELLDAAGTFPAEHRMIVGLDPVADKYREIEAETLVQLGGRSPEYLARAARFLADVVPRARLMVFPDLDHNAPDESAPDRVATALREFFAP